MVSPKRRTVIGRFDSQARPLNKTARLGAPWHLVDEFRGLSVNEIIGRGEWIRTTDLLVPKSDDDDNQ
jgi:hypothetical protein